MTAAAFAFLITGVLLNAAAQLLLKAGTNVLGVITLTRENWTDVLCRMATEVALQLAEIGPGDEVITPAQSFFAVSNMIVKVGATPVFVDCDLVTRNIDLAQVEARIGPRTRAIIPTHWPGSLTDMDALYA